MQPSRRTHVAITHFRNDTYKSMYKDHAIFTMWGHETQLVM